MADIRAKSFNFGGSDRYIIPQDFIINVTDGDLSSQAIQDITVDKAYAETLEAYNMGHTLYVFYSPYRLPLAGISNGMFLFMLNVGGAAITVRLSENGSAIGQKTNLEPVPAASASDAGKVLMVGDDGNAAWTAIINAEEVAY